MDTDERFGWQWTAAKLECVRKYLPAYTTIMAKQPYRVAYIDAFTGSGYWAEKREDDPDRLAFPELTAHDSTYYRDGSARIALATEPRFDKYILIETNPERAYRLRDLRVDFPDRAEDIEVVLTDMNSHLLDLCENRRWDHHRAVLFLDRSKNVPIYLLCFAAANKRGAPTAVKIAQDVMLKGLAK